MWMADAFASRALSEPGVVNAPSTPVAPATNSQAGVQTMLVTSIGKTSGGAFGEHGGAGDGTTISCGWFGRSSFDDNPVEGGGNGVEDSPDGCDGVGNGAEGDLHSTGALSLIAFNTRDARTMNSEEARRRSASAPTSTAPIFGNGAEDDPDGSDDVDNGAGDDPAVTARSSDSLAQCSSRAPTAVAVRTSDSLAQCSM